MSESCRDDSLSVRSESTCQTSLTKRSKSTTEVKKEHPDHTGENTNAAKHNSHPKQGGKAIQIGLREEAAPCDTKSDDNVQPHLDAPTHSGNALIIAALDAREIAQVVKNMSVVSKNFICFVCMLILM